MDSHINESPPAARLDRGPTEHSILSRVPLSLLLELPHLGLTFNIRRYTINSFEANQQTTNKLCLMRWSDHGRLRVSQRENVRSITKPTNHLQNENEQKQMCQIILLYLHI